MDDVLKSSVLGEEDAAYIESYGSSLSSCRLSDTSDGVLGQMLTYVLSVSNCVINDNLFFFKR